MNRRDFSAGAATILGAAAWALPGLGQAQVRKPEEGKEYLTLDKRAPMDAPAGKIEVIEFFWYSCPHCNAFEPKLVEWSRKLAPDVLLKRVPVGFQESFVPQQRLYYTLEGMGKLDTLHAQVFKSIHVDRMSVAQDGEILAWADRSGLNLAKFQEVYASFTVLSKVRRAIQLQDAFRVSGVPALGIAGRYYTDGELTGSMERALQVTDYLVAESRKTR